MKSINVGDIILMERLPTARVRFLLPLDAQSLSSPKRRLVLGFVLGEAID
jgi:hypothetical protein